MHTCQTSIKLGIPFLFLLLFSMTAELSAQDDWKDFTFTKNNSVNAKFISSIVQDNRGLIWIGTDDGLGRIEGFRNTFYYASNTNNAIVSNSISNLTTSTNGDIYFSTAQGCGRYNSSTRLIERIDTSLDLNRDFASSFVQHNKIVWICTENFLYKISDNRAVEQFPIPNHIDNHKGRYFDIVSDNKHTLWCGNGKYLAKYNTNTHQEEAHFLIANGGIDAITKLEFISDTIIAVGTWGKGLILFNTKTYQQQAIATKDKIIHAVAKLKINNVDCLLVGLDNGYAFVHGHNGRVIETTLPYQVHAICCDSMDKLIYLGTNAGLYSADLAHDNFMQFQNIRVEKNETQQSNIAKNVLPVNYFETPTYNFIRLVYGDGLLVCDKKWNRLKKIASLTNPETKESTGDITSITFCKDRYYVGTYIGLMVLDTNFKVLQVQNPSVDNIATDRRIENMLPWSDSFLICQSFHSISLYNWVTQKFINTVRFKNNKERNTVINITDMAIDANQAFVATEDGLYLLDLNSMKVEKYKLSINTTRFTAIACNRNFVFMATSVGLWQLNRKSGEVRQITRQQNLSSDLIFGLKLKNRFLYLATPNGLSIWDIDKSTLQKNIDQSAGLKENYAEGGLYVDNDNNIIVGSINLLTVIAPRVIANDAKANYLISDILCKNKPQAWSINTDAVHLNFPHDSNQIVILVAYKGSSQKVNKVIYYTVNGNEFSTQNGTIILNDLVHGTYTIKLKDDVFASNIKEIIITIRPPFYWSKTFLILMFCGLCAAGYLIYIQRIKTIKNRLLLEKTYQDKIKETEMQLLRTQMNPHFMFNSLNAINNQVLKNNTEQASEYITTFSKLMRNILSNSKRQYISLDQELESIQLYLELEAIRLEHKFDYSIKFDGIAEKSSISVPPLILQPFVENAIWHGINPKVGNGHIEIIVLDDGYFLGIHIIDDGIGRSASQAQNKNKTKHQSVGIQITKDRIMLQDKENDVQINDVFNASQEVIGTDVYIKIKLVEND